MSDTFKRYVWSSFVTFLTAFLVAIAPFLGDLPMDRGAIFALLFVGARAGVKALVEAYLAATPER